MLSLFIDASQVMDDLFWQQAYPGDRAALLASLKDPAARRFVEINYGPWDRLDGNAPFVAGVGPKPDAARLLSARHVEGGIRARQPAGQPQRVHRVASWREGRARGRAVLEAVRRLAATGRGPARAGRRPRRGPRSAQVPRAARQGAADGRLSRQRHGLARHEGQPHRPRHRADRDLRGQAVRLQGRVRGLRARQGHGVEQAAGEVRRDAAGAAAWTAGAGRLQGRDAGHGLRPQRLRRRVLRRRLQRGLEDHRHQPAERRAGAARQGHAPAAAQERHARQVRHDPGADRRPS